MNPRSEVAENTLTLGRAKESKNLLFVRIRCIFGHNTKELFGWRITLNIRAPFEQFPPRSDELSGFLITPDSRPAASGGAHHDFLVANRLGDTQTVLNAVHSIVAIHGTDPNGATDDEINIPAFGRVIGHVDIEMVCALLRTLLGQLVTAPP